MSILISSRELQSRPNSIRELLKPIAGHSIAAHRDTTDPKSITYGVLNGSKTTNAVRDWRFKTKNNELRGNYVEKWSQINNGFTLLFSYLSILQGQRDHEKEIFALHCDPNESIHSKFYKYKSGPHMHIITEDQRISNAHIALNIANHSEIIESYEKLQKAISDAIQMISSEFI
jgi:hypothetical protein